MTSHKITMEIIQLLNIPDKKTAELIGKSSDTVARKKSEKYPAYKFNDQDMQSVKSYAHGVINRLNLVL